MIDRRILTNYIKDNAIQHIFFLPDLTYPFKSFQKIQRFASIVNDKCVYQHHFSPIPLLIPSHLLWNETNTESTGKDTFEEIHQQCSNRLYHNVILDVSSNKLSLQEEIHDHQLRECKQFFNKYQHVILNHADENYCRLFLPQQLLFFSIPSISYLDAKKFQLSSLLLDYNHYFCLLLTHVFIYETSIKIIKNTRRFK